MYPDSPFARPVSSFRRPAPVLDVEPDVEPDKTVCFRSEWTPYIVGALRQLLLQTTWATADPDVLNLMQARAQLLIAMFMEGCPDEPAIEIPGLEFDGEELMPSLCESLRFENGKLQAWCCGEWTDISGQPAQGVGGSGQPGGGTPQPTFGACQSYHASFSANSQWIVPALVSSGDVLNFSNAGGAGHDGSISAVWECPSGQIFFGGACVGIPGFQPGDFNPAIAHMRLIAIINGVAYPADAGSLTVPGGVSEAQVVIQVNDSAIADNSGAYTLDVEVCNNQQSTGDWVYNLNFRLLPYSPFIVDSFAAWSPSTGFAGKTNGSVPNWAQIDITLSAFALDGIDLIYDAASLSGGSQGVFLQVNGAGYGTPVVPTVGTLETYTENAPIGAATSIVAVVSTGNSGGADHIQGMVIRGHGPIPPELP